MTKLEKIEKSVGELSHGEFWDFAERFGELLRQRWDRQIEENLVGGKLDDVIARAKAEIAAGKVKPI